MAMTNAERQTKWRNKLKEKAATGHSLPEAIREKMRELREDFRAESPTSDEGIAIGEGAFAAMLAMSDEEILSWLLNSIDRDLLGPKWREMAKIFAAKKKKADREAARRAKAVTNG